MELRLSFITGYCESSSFDRELGAGVDGVFWQSKPSLLSLLDWILRKQQTSYYVSQTFVKREKRRDFGNSIECCDS